MYKHIKQAGCPDAMQRLHHGQTEPPLTLSKRLQTAEQAWSTFWSHGVPFAVQHTQNHPPITQAEVIHIIDHMNPKKALGADHWRIMELRTLSPQILQALADFFTILPKHP